MASSRLSQLDIPESYAQLPLTQVLVSHYPESSSTATPVIVVTLNRPKRLNAYTPTMAIELERVFGLLDRDERVKVVVLAGAGKSFCAGADLEGGLSGGAEEGKARDADHRDGGGRISLAIHRCSKPTIAAIHGAAVGVGITMCLPACVRIAYSKAKIGFVFARRGLVLEACSSYYLPRLIGFSKALYLTTTGLVYPADSPYFGALMSELVSTPEQVLPRALELADEVAKNTSLVSTKLMREMMYRGPDSPEGAHLLDSKITHELATSKDFNEGVRSFLEKRPPHFTADVLRDAPNVYPWWPQIDTSPGASGINKSKL
ncbi:hypothetical protein AYO21_11916 [Fonsecaea monophora]|uniref:Enoyl-CoA hydratase n=1 Tax=Fonsecaea monophora TaxID=254056 RepID=A0A177EPM3_9EURO|nr:hypothetical protein AYO21_11916 [Fonsecaea monophora]KAH0829398.1 3-hydroxypropionyl-coenzyme A dehydratase [Fonsecaea pedrosoi]OAG33945.1 hypothetical protein AYO21_11916 [Fonsecaea monophora]